MATGPDELRELGRILQGMDETIRRDVVDSLKDAATTRLTDAIRAEARAVLPRRGGLADLVAETRISAEVELSGDRPGVRLAGEGPVALDRIDRGELVKPLFGDRTRWYEQRVQPGWWSRPIQDNADDVGRDLDQAVTEGIRRAVRD